DGQDDLFHNDSQLFSSALFFFQSLTRTRLQLGIYSRPCEWKAIKSLIGENCAESFGILEVQCDSRVTLSSSKNAVRFSSVRTTNRFPSSRCASAIQIVRS